MSKSEKKWATPAVSQGGILEKANMVHAMSYFPYFIGAVAMYFLGNTDKKAALHHIKYSAIVAFGICILLIILNGFFASVANGAYLILSGYFAYKAYKGEEIEVEFLDVIEDKISETIKK